MTDQPSLFDAVQRPATPAEEARDVAIEHVRAGAPTGWLTQALWAVHALARENAQFTTDEVWDRIPPPPEPRALGAVMKQATEKGWIVATDKTRKSKRVECHARPIRIWQSLIRSVPASDWKAA